MEEKRAVHTLHVWKNAPILDSCKLCVVSILVDSVCCFVLLICYVFDTNFFFSLFYLSDTIILGVSSPLTRAICSRSLSSTVCPCAAWLRQSNAIESCGKQKKRRHYICGSIVSENSEFLLLCLRQWISIDGRYCWFFVYFVVCTVMR